MYEAKEVCLTPSTIVCGYRGFGSGVTGIVNSSVS
jgi:hypothetical protein